MAIWKEQTSSKNDSTTIPQSPTTLLDEPSVAPAVTPSVSYRPSAPVGKESLIAAELTIEGKIEGAGHVRMAGNFKGNVNVDGNLTIEPGAKVTGSVRAHTIIIGGELEGNIDAASYVELLETGVLNGDLQASSFVVARGSRMRGQVSFGWDENSTNRRPTSSSAPLKKMEVLTGS